MSNPQSHSPEQKGSVERENTQQEQSWSTTKVLEQLKRYGVSGILSYGLLNTAYYLTTFLTVWFYFAPVPGKMGYLAAVSRKIISELKRLSDEDAQAAILICVYDAT